MHLDLSSHDEILENQFVEGFILLEDLDDDQDQRIDLSIPFLGFYGDWEKGYAIDAFEIKESNFPTKRNAQVIINKTVNSESSMFVTPAGTTLPVVDDVMYFSPNFLRYQKKNMYPSFGLRLGVLRNLDFVEYSILDAKTKETLKVLGKNFNIRKMNRLAIRPSFISLPESQWDGTIDDYEVKDGDRFLYQIRANLNNGTREDAEQIYQYEVRLDSSIPEITDNSNIQVEKLPNGLNRLRFKAQDSGSGLEDIYLQAVYFIDSAQSEKLKKEVVVNPEVTGGVYDKEKYAPRYKQAVAIKFINPNDPFFKLKKVDPAMILTPKNGQLHVPQDYFTRYNTKYVYCDIRGHYQDEIDISIDIKSHEEYLSIYVSDHCANRLGYYMHIGKDLDSHRISFDSYYINLKPNGALLSINDATLNDDHIEAQGKSRVSIAFPKKDNVLTKVKLSNTKGEDFLNMDKALSEEMKQKYNATFDGFNLSFELDAANGNYDIMTWTEKYIPESEMATVSFEGFDFSKFKDAQLKISSDKNMQDVKIVNATNRSVKLPKSNIYISAQFLQKEDISLVEIVANRRPTILLGAFDLAEFYKEKNVYYLAEPKKVDFSAKFELKDHVTFNILYGGGGGGGWFPFPFGNDNSSGSNAGAGSNSGANTGTDSDSGTNAKSNSKYPIIVLRSPALLDIKTGRDLTNEGLLIEGFVGHIKEDL